MLYRFPWRGASATPMADAQPLLRVGPGVDPTLLPDAVASSAVSVCPDSRGRVEVKAFLASQKPEVDAPVIVIVAEDLDAPGCRSVFGYADPKQRKAVVSIARLSDGGNSQVLRQRLSKVIAHEWMHLRGRKHCKQPGCLMYPVQTPAELDARGHSLCWRCRKKLSWKGTAIAAGIAIVLSGALDLTVSAFQTKSRPFTWRADPQASTVLYQGDAILRIPEDAHLRKTDRARFVAQSLNAMFVEIDPPLLDVQGSGQEVRVTAGGRDLFAVTPEMTEGRPAAAFAKHWVAQLQPLLEGKGRPGESCPMCHINKREQVRKAVAQPPRFWR